MFMKAISSLPDGYEEIFSVNLAKDKKIALGLNLSAVLVALIMAIPMHFHISIITLFDLSEGLIPYILRSAVLLVCAVAYIILHELAHGITMKYFGCKKVKYGYNVLYAYAGSDEYFDKKSYVVIALAPVVFWGIVITVINVFVPENWFWVVYLIQIFNITGAAGDIYVTIKFSKMPDDILINDTGVSMTVFSKNKN